MAGHKHLGIDHAGARQTKRRVRPRHVINPLQLKVAGRDVTKFGGGDNRTLHGVQLRRRQS